MDNINLPEPPKSDIFITNHIHSKVRELSDNVLYALRTKQLTTSHVFGGILNEMLVDKEHYIEDQGHFFSPEEMAKHQAILDTLVDLMVMLNDLEWIGEQNA
jgi:hypothetical protein